MVGSVSYAALVMVLRVSGKRTLGQLNAFDFIVTVAIGSTLATILLSSGIAFFEGLTALVLLVGLQFVVAWSSAHVPGAMIAVTARPVVLVISGELQHDQLRRNRLSESEVLQAVRSTGSGDLSDVAAVVLETNGTLSVIPHSKLGNGSTLKASRAATNWGPMTEPRPHGRFSVERPASRNGHLGARFGLARSKVQTAVGVPAIVDRVLLVVFVGRSVSPSFPRFFRVLHPSGSSAGQAGS
ncbi:MAG TPA: YetF domain-containing protein [Arthrobacter sp.]